MIIFAAAGGGSAILIALIARLTCRRPSKRTSSYATGASAAAARVTKARLKPSRVSEVLQTEKPAYAQDQYSQRHSPREPPNHMDSSALSCYRSPRQSPPQPTSARKKRKDGPLLEHASASILGEDGGRGVLTTHL